jgi:hypothetical protein
LPEYQPGGWGLTWFYSLIFVCSTEKEEKEEAEEGKEGDGYTAVDVCAEWITQTLQFCPGEKEKKKREEESSQSSKKA